jgi:hypothetical protein
MDMNEYCLSAMVQERLREMRREAEYIALRGRAQARPPLRVTIGHALVRLGNRLLSGFTAVRAPA